MSELFDPCQCEVECALGAPPSYGLTLMSGITDGTCPGGEDPGCSAINSVLYVIPFGDSCNYFLNPDPEIRLCDTWQVEFGIAAGSCGMTLELTLDGVTTVVWEGTPPDGHCIDEFELDLITGDDRCDDWPSTVKLAAIDPLPSEVHKSGAVGCWNKTPCFEIPSLAPAVGTTPYDANCSSCGCSSPCG